MFILHTTQKTFLNRLIVELNEYAQIKAMKQVAGNLRLDLASYRELQAFTQFGSDLDSATKQQLNRGSHMTELLIQSRYTPINVYKKIKNRKGIYLYFL